LVSRSDERFGLVIGQTARIHPGVGLLCHSLDFVVPDQPNGSIGNCQSMTISTDVVIQILWKNASRDGNKNSPAFVSSMAYQLNLQSHANVLTVGATASPFTPECHASNCPVKRSYRGENL
jgi:hypothetical protein